MKKTIPSLLGIIQAFVAVGALPAGLSLILDPSGKSFGFTADILDNSPFENFLIPGFFLFIIFGLAHIVAAVLSFGRNRNTGVIGSTLGLFLVVWICLQFYFIGFVQFLQPLFLIIGLIEIILAYLLIKQTKSIT